MQQPTMPTRATIVKLAEQVGLKWQYRLHGEVLYCDRVTIEQLLEFAKLIKELK